MPERKLDPQALSLGAISGYASPQSPTALVAEIEQALQGQLEPFMQRLKQITLEVIDEVGDQHVQPFVVQLRQTLLDTVAAVLKTEIPALLKQLKPAIAENSEAVRQNADGLLGDVKQFVTKTAVEVFREQIPEYSRRTGQRVLDYFLAGTLFCLAAVLLCLGGILGLEAAGVPAYAAYLAGGGAALAVGLFFLKLRARRSTTTSEHRRLSG
jgi:hypothetical protein